MSRLHHLFLLSILGCSSEKMPDMLGDPPPMKDSGSNQTKDSGPSCSLLQAPDAGEAGSCGDLALCGYYVTKDILSGNAPTPVGGTIVDGIYRLTSAHQYMGGTSTKYQETLEVKNNLMHFTIQNFGDTTIQNDVFAYMVVTPEGGATMTEIDLVSVCGGGIGALNFTATPTQLTLQRPGVSGVLLEVLDKQ